jgi:hypothetical protein
LRAALAALVLLGVGPCVAFAVSMEDLRDPEDGRFDTSRFLLDLKGFLPVPIIVTEPAVGYGGGAALLFFTRNPVPLGEDRAIGSFVPPDITAVAGFRTENGSQGGGVGHLGFTRDRNWRYAAGAGRVSLNLALFGEPVLPGGGSADGLGYNIEATFALADVRRRLGDSDWFAGLRYVRADTSSRFDATRPESIPARQLDSTIAGLAVVAEYDGRDNIFTPNAGTRLSLHAYDFGKAFGGDAEFRRYTAAVNSYREVLRDVVLGARVDYRGVTGDAPFYARPFIELRGIPVMRYQGDRVAVAELEARWNLDGRWSLVGFTGVGRASDRSGDLGSAASRITIGAGFRYYLARALGLHAGIDVARGPEESAFYIIIGSAWR